MVPSPWGWSALSSVSSPSWKGSCEAEITRFPGEVGGGEPHTGCLDQGHRTKEQRHHMAGLSPAALRMPRVLV